MRIALINDDISALWALQRTLSVLRDVELFMFRSGSNALFDAEINEFDVLVCAYFMPVMDGIEVIRQFRLLPKYQAVPIIMVTSHDERATRLRAVAAGATEFLHKSIDAAELVGRVGNHLALRKAYVEMRDRARLLDGAMSLATLAASQREEEAIWRLARAIDARDGKTGEHISRMAALCLLIARQLGLPPETCRMIHRAAPLHDVGKIGIPDAILFKPDLLTPAEYALMQRHVEIGVRILDNATSDLVQLAQVIAGGHHERWNGSGYPRGLIGTAIPIEARIAAIADVFDALCTERPYKRAWPLEEARDEIVAQSGQLFDPACVDAFLQCWPRIVACMPPGSTSTNSHKPARSTEVA